MAAFFILMIIGIIVWAVILATTSAGQAPRGSTPHERMQWEANKSAINTEFLLRRQMWQERDDRINKMINGK